jgi:hypothetical protein
MNPSFRFVVKDRNSDHLQWPVDTARAHRKLSQSSCCVFKNLLVPSQLLVHKIQKKKKKLRTTHRLVPTLLSPTLVNPGAQPPPISTRQCFQLSQYVRPSHISPCLHWWHCHRGFRVFTQRRFGKGRRHSIWCRFHFRKKVRWRPLLGGTQMFQGRFLFNQLFNRSVSVTSHET